MSSQRQELPLAVRILLFVALGCAGVAVATVIIHADRLTYWCAWMAAVLLIVATLVHLLGRPIITEPRNEWSARGEEPEPPWRRDEVDRG